MDQDRKPEVQSDKNGLIIKVKDPILDRDLELETDLLIDPGRKDKSRTQATDVLCKGCGAWAAACPSCAREQLSLIHI